MNRQDVVVGRFDHGLGLVQVQPPAGPAVLVAALAAGVLHEDAPHGLRGCGEEVAAAIPALRLIGVHESQVRFVDQGRGRQRLPRRFLGHLLRRQLAQLLVDQRQELLGGVRVALLDGAQDASDSGH